MTEHIFVIVGWFIFAIPYSPYHNDISASVGQSAILKRRGLIRRAS
ncbi:hypothetical protein [Sphingobium chlorophenolicum]|nr:hypothetical protein [Sphingobium chlorophenolicum]